MSTEPPSPPARPARPDTDFRRRALVAHGHPPAAPVAVGQRPSLQDELARIPDLADDDRADGAAAGIPAGSLDAGEGPAAASDGAHVAVVAGGDGSDRGGSDGEAAGDAGPHERPSTRQRLRAAAARLGEAPAANGRRGGAGPGPAPTPTPPGPIDVWGVDVREIDKDVATAGPDAEAAADRADRAVLAQAAGAAVAAAGPADDLDADDVAVEPGGPLVHAVAAARIEKAQRRMVRPEPLVLGEPARPPWWRRVGFAAAVLVLVAAIPALGVEGYRLVTNSTDGRFGTAVRSPKDPGYQEPVTPTPTALVMQTDADGAPVALAVLVLSSSSGGGSVILVPLDTAVRKPAYGVDRIGRAYDVLKERPTDGRKQVAFQVASTLNIGLDEVIELDDRRWAQLVEPYGSLSIQNPDPVVVDGTEIPSGPVQLAPDQVGPFLAARSGEEGDLNRMNRQSLVWAAWLDAVGHASPRATLPGEQDSGIALFATSLAKGDVAFEPLPGSAGSDGSYVVDEGQLTDLIVDAVPAPTAAYPGSRAAVRVLNGWAPDPPPDELLRRIVHVQGSINSIGNGPEFGRRRSLIVYGDPAEKGHAELLAAALGGLPQVELDRTADDQVDLTLIVGKDVLDDLADEGGGG